MTDFAKAKEAARYFGAEAVANDDELNDDYRWSIAWYYFDKKARAEYPSDWPNIPPNHKRVLVDEFRLGEQIEREAQRRKE